MWAKVIINLEVVRNLSFANVSASQAKAILRISPDVKRSAFAETPLEVNLPF
jgi:hypothetical protein